MTAVRAFLFAADLDGTLLPNTGRPGSAGCLERTRDLLRRLSEEDIPVCYVTGRHLDLARQGIESFGLPPPTHWLCNVGTEIYAADGTPDLDWREYLGPALDHEGLRASLAAVEGLSLQEVEKQGCHKLSFYFPRPASKALRREILRRAARGSQGLQLVASVEESSGRALLDIIPASAGKRNAVAYTARRYGFPEARAFFAGDSGNDLDVLLSGVCGTLVGNTPPEVKALWLDARRPESRCHFARASYGDGVIEGLRHYRLWPPPDPLELTGS